MGEIANDLIDIGYDMMNDGYDEGEEEDRYMYNPRHRYRHKRIMCSYCGSENVHWEYYNGWKLVTPSGNIHSCLKSKFKIKCKYCGIDGLRWKRINGGWRLFTKIGNQHSCLGGV